MFSSGLLVLNPPFQLTYHFSMFMLGVMILGPIFGLIIFGLKVIRWYKGLGDVKSNLEKLDNLQDFNSESEMAKRKDLTKGISEDDEGWIKLDKHSKLTSLYLEKKGWLRVTTTPNPLQAPTLFEMVQDIMIKNWYTSTNFLSNPGGLFNGFSKLTGNGGEGEGVEGEEKKRWSLSGRTSSLGSEKDQMSLSSPNSSSKSDLFWNSYNKSEVNNSKDLTDMELDNDFDQDEPFDHDLTQIDSFHPSIASKIDFTNMKPNDHRKLTLSQRASVGWYFCILEDTTLKLFKDEKCNDLVTVLHLPMYDVGLYPFDLKENECFYPTHPILLAGHSIPLPDPINPSTSSSHESHFPASSAPRKLITGFTPNLSTTPPQNGSNSSSQAKKLWLPNYYLFSEGSCDKENWFLSLIPRCRHVIAQSEPLTQKLNINKVKKKPASEGFSITNQCTQLKPGGFDPLYWQDVKARMLGSNLESNQSDMSWLNAILSRLYLGVKDSTLLFLFLKDSIKSYITPKLPPWFKVSLKGCKLGPRVPAIPFNPKLVGMNSLGQITLKVPIQHFGPLISLNFRMAIDFNQMTIKWLKSFLNYIISPFRFSLSVEMSLNELNQSDPFQSTLLLRVHNQPTNLIWLGLTSLPQPDQLHITFTINKAKSIILPRFLKIWLLRLGNPMVYPNMINIPFLKKELMIPLPISDLEKLKVPTPALELSIPLLIKTLTENTNQHVINPPTCQVPLQPKLSNLDLQFVTGHHPGQGKLYESVKGTNPFINAQLNLSYRSSIKARRSLPPNKSNSEDRNFIQLTKTLRLSYHPEARPKVTNCNVITLLPYLEILQTHDDSIQNECTNDDEDDQTRKNSPYQTLSDGTVTPTNRKSLPAKLPKKYHKGWFPTSVQSQLEMSIILDNPLAS